MTTLKFATALGSNAQAQSAPTINQSVSGLGNRASDTISGTDPDGVLASVEIYDTFGGSTVDLGTALISGGGWSFTAGGLANGTHAFTAVATSKSGNSTAPTSAGAALVVDTVGPMVSVAQSVSGFTTSTSNTLSGTALDIGSGVAAVEIFQNSNGQTIDLGSATLNGTDWTYTVTNLIAGTYQFYAVGFDKAGNTTAPIATGGTETVVVQTPNALLLTATESASGGTNHAIDTISGTVTGGTVAKVEVYDTVGGLTVYLGDATVSGAGWSLTAGGLSNGTHAFSAVATNKTGSSTAFISAGPSLFVDTVAPTVTVSQSVSGTTTSTSNTLSGKVFDAGTGVAAVEIFQNSAGRTTDMGSATLNGSNWSYRATNLTPGTYTFYAVGFDKAGNTTAAIVTGAAETVVAPLGSAKALVAQASTTVAAATFAASIGVNTHLDTTWTSYANTARVINELKYLGVGNVRDSMAAPGDDSLFKTVAAATGVRFNVFLSLSGLNYDAEIAQIKNSASILKSVEGINEGDFSLSAMSYGGQTGYGAIAAVQTALYTAMKSNPATSNVTVIAPSYGSSSSFAVATNTAAVSDAGNAHIYSGTGNPPGPGIGAFITQSSLVSGNKPVIATEAGFYTGGSLAGSIAAYQHSGVSELVQAKYNLTVLFDDWKAGIKNTYLYELMDDLTDPNNTNSENHFGLFNTDGTPKIAATAVHNLMKILADDGPGRNDVFGYQIAQAPSTANSLLLEKSSGVFDLVIWNDIRLSEVTTGNNTVNPAVPVTISFGQLVQSVTEYDPLLGTSAVFKLNNTNQVSLNLPDHPVILEITPYGTTQVSLQNFALAQTVESSQSTGNLAGTLIANAMASDPAALSTMRITAVGTANTHGTVKFDLATQSVIYTAPIYSPLSPIDSFTYTLADAQGDSITGTVAVTETAPPNTLYGTTAGDRLNAPGTGWTMVGLAAGEQLYTAFSNVTFIGGADTNMYGGTDNNIFSAADGNHYVGAGNNARITMGDGDNTFGLIGSGNVVVTGNGNNLLYRSTGSTSITMGDGNQAITAGGSDNVISIGIGTSTINVGTDASSSNERVTVGGGTNTINAVGSGDIILVKSGTSNQIVSQGSAASITIQAGSNNVIAQGANSVIAIVSGTNTIGTNGDGDTINLGSGRDILWAGGAGNRINAGSGIGSITFVGQNDTIDLTHGTTTLSAQGASATLILATVGGTAAQIFGNVMAAGDRFDLRTALAATNWDCQQGTLASYLSVGTVGNASTLSIDADGGGPGMPAAIAVLNDVSSLSYAGLLSHAILPAWR